MPVEIKSDETNTAQATYSISTGALAARLAAVRTKFVAGQKFTAADVNELIAIIRIFQTHTHSFQDKFFIQFGNIFIMNTRIDPDVTQPPKLIP